jgi:RimJ/RimL family protein N-acetyltransferase
VYPSPETERLRLERWDHEAHRAPFAAVNADPEVGRFVGGASPMTRTASDELSERTAWHWDRFGFGLWAAIVKDTGAIVGFIGLCRPLLGMTEQAELPHPTRDHTVKILRIACSTS